MGGKKWSRAEFICVFWRWCVLLSGSGGCRPEEGRHRHVGDQRGLQRGGAGQHQDVGHRPLKSQREWRRCVPGTPHWVSAHVTLHTIMTLLEPHCSLSERKTSGEIHVRALRRWCELSLLPLQDVGGQNRGSHGAQPEAGPVRTGGHLQRRRRSFVHHHPEAVGVFFFLKDQSPSQDRSSTSFYCNQCKCDRPLECWGLPQTAGVGVHPHSNTPVCCQVAKKLILNVEV